MFTKAELEVQVNALEVQNKTLENDKDALLAEKNILSSERDTLKEQLRVLEGLYDTVNAQRSNYLGEVRLAQERIEKLRKKITSLKIRLKLVKNLVKWAIKTK